MTSNKLCQYPIFMILATAMICAFGCATQATSSSYLKLVPATSHDQIKTLTPSEARDMPTIFVSNTEIINFDGAKTPIVMNSNDGYLDVPDSSYRGDTLAFISSSISQIKNHKAESVVIIPGLNTQYILLKGILRTLTYSGVSKVYLPFGDKLYPIQLPRKTSNSQFVQSINADSSFLNVLVLNDSIRIYTGSINGDWQVIRISDLNFPMQFNQDLNALETGKNISWISIDPHPGCRYERISNLLELIYTRRRERTLYNANLLGFMPEMRY